jgi:hypothetical protein
LQVPHSQNSYQNFWIAIPKLGEFQNFLREILRCVTVRLEQDLFGPITSFPITNSQRLNKVLFETCRSLIPGIRNRIIWIIIPKFGEVQIVLTGILRSVTVRFDQDLLGPITSFPITNSCFFYPVRLIIIIKLKIL